VRHALCCLFLLAAMVAPARAQLNGCEEVRPPASTPLDQTSAATADKGAALHVGPGDLYMRVRNAGAQPVSFGLSVRKPGTSLLRAICYTVGIVRPGDEYWLKGSPAADDIADRVVDLFTGVTDASLELAIFRQPNLLPVTVSTESIRFRLRAFIPNELKANPTYVSAVPGHTGKTMIHGTVSSSLKAILSIGPDGLAAAADCYMTDNRGFSSERFAAAKVTTEFVVRLHRGQVWVQPSSDAAHVAGDSTRIDCSTGNTIRVLPGAFSAPFGVRALGKPAIADGKVQIGGQVAVGNPHIFGAPMIDYSFDLIYDVNSRKLRYDVTTGVFPAFEFHVIRNNKPPITVLQLPPKAEDAWGLQDGGIGVKQERVTGEIQL
jgi:hypothetical protein